MKRIRTEPHGDGAEGDERIRTAEQAPSADPVYELLAEIALLAWNATGGSPGLDTTDEWNRLCTLLENQPDSFGDDLRAVLDRGAAS